MTPVRIGIIGCGSISQVHHLPNLQVLRDEFEIAAVCDISESLVEQIATEYSVPRHFTDYRELLATDIDAALLCLHDPKTEYAIACFEADKHTFIEKPLCYTLEDADAIIEANRSSGRVGQIGYMKVHDPAFELVEREVRQMEGIRYVQVNHLHTDNSHHLAHFRLLQAEPPSAEMAAASKQLRRANVVSALGEVTPDIEKAFYILSGSLLHDLYGLRHLFGTPARVLNTEIWNDGWGIATTLEYDMGARCVAVWIELPHIREFRETLEVNADDRRVSLFYPTGFARGILSQVKIEGVDESGRAFVREPSIEWESPFLRELRHFHSCIVDGIECRTPVEAARDDVKLVGDIVRCYLATS